MRKFTLFAARSVALCARIFVALCATLALCAALSGCSGMINGDPDDGRGSSSGGSSYNGGSSYYDPSTTDYYGNVDLYWDGNFYGMNTGYGSYSYSREPCYFLTLDSSYYVVSMYFAPSKRGCYKVALYSVPQYAGETVACSANYSSSDYGNEILSPGNYTVKFFPRSQMVTITCNALYGSGY